jgi:hypothetical protein
MSPSGLSTLFTDRPLIRSELNRGFDIPPKEVANSAA